MVSTERWVWIKGKIGLHREPPVDDGREMLAAELDRIAALVRANGARATWNRRLPGPRTSYPGSELEIFVADGTHVRIEQ